MTVSLRMVMKRIVQTVCGVLCEEVVVVTPRQFEPRMYLVQVPIELRPDVYLHVAEYVGVPISPWSDALYLSAADAEKLQEYAETLTESNVTLPRRLPTHEVEQDSYALAE